MKITIIGFTQNGGLAVKKLADKLGADGYLFEKYKADGLTSFGSLSELVGEKFNESDALVFVGACGIAVRAIAPYVRSKATDCAVVVMDERERFVIPILSGHIGGANELAEKIAEITGAAAVITTATDINNVFSVDTFAVKNNLYISDLHTAKLISAEFLSGKKIGLYSDFAVKNVPDCICENAEIGICISHDILKKPFKKTLNLAPENIVIGIGCKKGTPDVKKLAEKVLSEHNIIRHAVFAAASIDVKRDEQAIKSLCRDWGLEFLTYSADELMAQKGDFTKSDFVMKTVGADNVCERSVAASGARLMVKKTAENGVTIAIGETEFEADFNS